MSKAHGVRLSLCEVLTASVESEFSPNFLRRHGDHCGTMWVGMDEEG